MLYFGRMAAIKNKDIKMASGAGIKPEAIGRFFLKGCNLSRSMSKTSLSKYVAEENIQNSKNASRVLS